MSTITINNIQTDNIQPKIGTTLLLGSTGDIITNIPLITELNISVIDKDSNNFSKFACTLKKGDILRLFEANDLNVCGTFYVDKVTKGQNNVILEGKSTGNGILPMNACLCLYVLGNDKPIRKHMTFHYAVNDPNGVTVSSPSFIPIRTNAFITPIPIAPAYAISAIGAMANPDKEYVVPYDIINLDFSITYILGGGPYPAGISVDIFTRTLPAGLISPIASIPIFTSSSTACGCIPVMISKGDLLLVTINNPPGNPTIGPLRLLIAIDVSTA